MKCLVVRFSSIGDIVLTTPVIRSIKKHNPLAEVHFLTKHKFSSTLKANPYVSKLYTIDKNLSEIITKLNSENYDFIFDLHHNLRTLELKLKLRRPSYSFNKVNVQKWLYIMFKTEVLPKVHVVDRYLKVINDAGIPSDGKGLDYFIPESDKVDFTLFPNEFRLNYTALVIGGTYATKRLPKQKLADLCRKIKGAIFIIGGPQDKSIAKKLKEEIGDRVYNGCGLFNLNESADIVKHARVVVTHDTGMMHIAAAFQKKIISIWGNTVPEFGMTPFIPKVGSKIFEVKGLSCRPCSKLGFRDCPKKHFKCMEDQDISAIAKQVNA